MRIVHVIDHLARSHGDVAVCLRLAAEQAARGHVCVVRAAMAVPGAVPAGGQGLEIRVGAGSRTELSEELRAFRPDLVHVHGFWHPFASSAAAAAARTGCVVVLSPHGVLAPWVLRRRRLLKTVAWWTCRRHYRYNIRALHATGPGEADDIRAFGFRQPVATIPIGVDLPPAVVMPDIRGAPERTALFLSRLHPRKGLPDLLQAWSRIPRAGWRLVVAGPDSNGQRAVLESLRAALRLDDVSFPGEVLDENREAFYRRADLFVLPSFSENFGLVVAEALAHGVPVITTRGTPWQDLETRRCGWWIAHGAAPLADALRHAMALSDGERRDMGARGRELVTDCYTWDRCAEKMLAWYRDLAQK